MPPNLRVSRLNLFLPAALLLLLTPFAQQAQGQPGRPSVQLRNNRAEAVVVFQRPLRGSERGPLVRSGVRVYRALGGSRYLVRVNRDGLAALQSHPLFVSVSEVDTNSKVSATIRSGNPAPHALAGDGSIRVTVRFYPDVNFGQANSALRRSGLTPADGKTGFDFGNQLEAAGTVEQILRLSTSFFVETIQEVSPPGQLDNATAAALSNVDDVQAAPYNLTGNGVNVGLWDGGSINSTHPDFGNPSRVTQSETGSDPAADMSHGTHVTGTMAGSGAGNATARGMATQATVFAHRFRDGDPVAEQQDSFDNEGIRASNHSWGPILGWNLSSGTWSQTGSNNLFGAYEGNAVNWDNLVRGRPTLTVMKSSGNDDGDCDPSDATDCDGVLNGAQYYDLIGTFGNSKNVITVGALNDDGTTKANFSGTGPADDGRIKPDITANGVTLTSTCLATETPGPGGLAGYCIKGGTSMSTPVVTGTVALMIQHYRQRYGVTAAPSADIMKALLTNTADDLGRPGPDYQFGFGRLNALAAAQTVDAGPVRILTGAVDAGDTDEFLLPVPAGLANLRVTLNWLDPAGGASTDDDEGTSDLINNLDLELVAPDNSLRFPFTGPGRGNETVNATNTGANNVDNVEQAVVPNPAQGFWKVRVRGTAVPDGPQNYAVVSNVSFSLPGQPEIEVNAPLAFDELCAGGQQDRTVSIFNTGGGVMQISSISVGGSPAFSILPTSPSAPLLIQPGAHIDLTVRFAPTTQNGTFNGTLTIVSNDADEGTLVLPISGSTGAPSIDAVIATQGNFGNVCREGFKDLNLTINNSGSCPLTLTGITSSSTDFTVATVLAYPVTIEAGDNIDVPIRYQSVNLGPDTGTITINSNAQNDTTLDVNVSGIAPPGDLQVSGSTDFGNVCAGSNAEKILSLCNLGLCNLNVTSVTLEDGNGGACTDFVLVNNPFATPAPISKDFCAPVTIRFTPTSIGPKQCVIKIVTDDPDTPIVTRTVTGNTPVPQLTVVPNLSFLPEVIQSVGACTTPKPAVIANNGLCPVTVNDAVISAGAGDYAISGKPVVPIPVQPGHQLGEGDFRAVFGPLAIDRDVLGTLSVTWVTDPFLNTTTVSNMNLCGEGVNTGARILVRAGNVPVPLVEKIQIQRATGNRNKPNLNTVDTVMNLQLVSITPASPCTPFQYHREYGTIANPTQLLPGSYVVTVTAVIGGKRKSKTVGFDVTTCDFNPQVIVDF